MPLKILTLALTFSFFVGASDSMAFQQPPSDAVRIGTIGTPSIIPESCKRLAEIAEEKYDKTWKTSLLVSLETDKESTKEAEKIFQNEKNNGHVVLNRRLGPPGTVAIFVDRRDLMGNISSLFVNCEKKLAYVSVQGGMQGETRFYGPFKIETN